MKFGVTIKGGKEILDDLSPKMIRSAMRSALKRTASSVKTAIDVKIREGYNIKKMDLSKAMKVWPKASDFRAEIVVTDEGREPPGVFKFGGRAAVQTKEGTYVEIRKRKIKLYPQAFIATMGSGHKGVFIRKRGGTGKGGRMTRRDVAGLVNQINPPIHEIHGPYITSLVRGAVIQDTIQNKFNEVMQKNFDHEIDVRLKKYVK